AGLLAALLPEVWRERSLRTGLLYALWAGAVAASFGLLVVGPIRAQHNAVLDAYWSGDFPDLEHAWRLPGWVAGSTLDILHYACNPIGAFLGVFAAVGAGRLWRGGGGRLLLPPPAAPPAAPLAAAGGGGPPRRAPRHAGSA